MTTLTTSLSFSTTVSAFQANLRQIIRQARTSRALSQHDLARLIGIHENQIQRWETGGVPVTMKALLQISLALDYSLDISLTDESPLPWPPPLNPFSMKSPNLAGLSTIYSNSPTVLGKPTCEIPPTPPSSAAAQPQSPPLMKPSV